MKRICPHINNNYLIKNKADFGLKYKFVNRAFTSENVSVGFYFTDIDSEERILICIITTLKRFLLT